MRDSLPLNIDFTWNKGLLATVFLSKHKRHKEIICIVIRTIEHNSPYDREIKKAYIFRQFCWLLIMFSQLFEGITRIITQRDWNFSEFSDSDSTVLSLHETRIVYRTESEVPSTDTLYLIAGHKTARILILYLILIFSLRYHTNQIITFPNPFYIDNRRRRKNLTTPQTQPQAKAKVKSRSKDEL